MAIADKLDSIISFFATGMIPSGSNDPYALRRQAYGIVRMMAEQGWHLPLLDMQSEFADAIQKAGIETKFDYQKNAGQVREFFMDRLKQFFNAEKMRHDIVDAVTDTNQYDIVNILAAAKSINEQKDDDGFKDDIEALTRVLRIAKKGQGQDSNINSQLFQNPSEEKLFNAVNNVADDFSQEDMDKDLRSLRSLSSVITEYFDENMIMDKDEQIKNNRLAQLQEIANMTKELGNLDLLIVK